MNMPEEKIISKDSAQSSLHQMIVLNAITADLFKAQNGALTYYDAKIGKNWDLKKNTALDFVKVIERKFAKNNKFHGYFSPKNQHMAPVVLQEFVDGKIRFEQLVKAFVDNACDEANLPTRGTLTLGHLVMVHYKTQNDADDVGRFLAVLVGKQDGFDFDSDLQPVDLTSINTSELRHAAMFDLTLFKETFPKNDGDAYLKFITGKSKSAFLKDAFGCSDHIPNRDSVEQVRAAVLDFLNDPSIPESRRLKIVDGVTMHLVVAAKRNISVSIQDIQKVINDSLPLGSNKIDGFSGFVNDGGYTISERFQPTRISAQLLQNVEIADPQAGFKCSINIQSISYTDAEDRKIITVDEDLTSINIPLTPQAREVIKKILGGKGELDQQRTDTVDTASGQ
ncbi:TPA: nucleoid-associated protein [Pseudomonas aeruginosa]|nr:nucleoid-associated protein [Pseudomonas aeruginosa]HBO4448916.1 nucleoid-associated protein [Pseudomonas aeruginosa]